MICLQESKQFTNSSFHYTALSTDFSCFSKNAIKVCETLFENTPTHTHKDTSVVEHADYYDALYWSSQTNVPQVHLGRFRYKRMAQYACVLATTDDNLRVHIAAQNYIENAGRKRQRSAY